MMNTNFMGDYRNQYMRDYVVPLFNDLNPGIFQPEIQAPHIELKPVMFQMLQNMGQFSGMATEDPYRHLCSFLQVSDSFKLPRVSADALRMKLFPFSLRDSARAWINSVSHASMSSWNELAEKFLMRYNRQMPTNRVAAATKTATGNHGVDVLNELTDQIASLHNLMSTYCGNFPPQVPVEEQRMVDVSCVYCGDMHPFGSCPFYSASMGCIGGQNTNENDPYSNSYISGWEQHQDFSWGYQSSSSYEPHEYSSGFQQEAFSPPTQNNSLESLLKKYIEKNEVIFQNQATSIQKLADQFGHLASEMRNQAQCVIPSEINDPKKDEEHFMDATLRSGKDLVLTQPKDKILAEPTVIQKEENNEDDVGASNLSLEAADRIAPAKSEQSVPEEKFLILNETEECSIPELVESFAAENSRSEMCNDTERSETYLFDVKVEEKNDEDNDQVGWHELGSQSNRKVDVLELPQMNFQIRKPLFQIPTPFIQEPPQLVLKPPLVYLECTYLGNIKTQSMMILNSHSTIKETLLLKILENHAILIEDECNDLVEYKHLSSFIKEVENEKVIKWPLEFMCSGSSSTIKFYSSGATILRNDQLGWEFEVNGQQAKTYDSGEVNREKASTTLIDP